MRTEESREMEFECTLLRVLHVQWIQTVVLLVVEKGGLHLATFVICLFLIYVLLTINVQDFLKKILKDYFHLKRSTAFKQSFLS